ncbi:MAG: signal recognition particle protein [Thermoprotei archaeon ex4572_64]|nr:MAG: signal recognition particle protein [Thermoprotei archaeon ex4572_64]
MKILVESFTKLISRIKGLKYIDEETLRELLKELQKILLKADVSVQTIYTITKTIEEKFKNTKPPEGISIKDYLIYLLYQELINALGGDYELKIELPKRPYKLMLIGVEGCGKTTSAAKIAKLYLRKKFRVGLIETDTHRPGAQDQLKQLADRVGALFYGDLKVKMSSDEILVKGLEYMLKSRADLIIIDTAGRHKSEEDLMSEVKRLYELAQPDEVMLVIDATSGKQAATQAEAFMKYVPIHSIFITKMDSTARGGGALMSVIKTGAKIKFIGIGEDVDEIELFNPRRFVSRLLGMGDLETLVEKIRSIEEEEKLVKEIEKDIEEGKFTLLTVKKQIESILKLGPLSKLLQLLPTSMFPNVILKNIDEEQAQLTQERMRRWYVILNSMTREELLNPDILNASRIRRIAKGSGTSPRDIKELLQYYQLMRRWISSLKKSRRRLLKFFEKGFPQSI